MLWWESDSDYINILLMENESENSIATQTIKYALSGEWLRPLSMLRVERDSNHGGSIKHATSRGNTKSAMPHIALDK